MSEMRKEFEVWAKDRAIKANYQYMEGLLYRLSSGDYSVTWVDVAFEAWQASRAALVVELPNKITEENRLQSGHVLPEVASYDEAIDDCADAIRESGITVKGED